MESGYDRHTHTQLFKREMRTSDAEVEDRAKRLGKGESCRRRKRSAHYEY